jgi:hypothetical protein
MCKKPISNFTGDGVPIQYLNGSVTFQDGWDTDQNTTAQDLRDMWDSMAVNFWPVMTLFVPVTNGSSPPDVEPGLARLSCISPDGIGTGKVFSYSDSTGSKTSSTSTNPTAGAGSRKGAADMIQTPLHWVVLGTLALLALLV